MAVTDGMTDDELAVVRRFYLWERQNCYDHPQREDGKGDPCYLLRRYCSTCQQSVQVALLGND